MDSIWISQDRLVISAVILIITGLLSTYFGYGIFRLYLVLVGILVGGMVGIALGGESSTLVIVLLAALGAFIGGIIMYFLYYVGVFLAGIVFGAVVGAVIGQAVGIQGGGGLAFIAIGALVGGILAFFIAKYIIMLSTSFTGAAQIVFGALLLLPDTTRLVPGSPGMVTVSVTDTASLLTTLAWLGIGISGFVVQFRANRGRLGI